MKKLLLILSLAFSLNANAQCWKKVTGSRYHTLAIKTDSSLWGWGRNYVGELGDGTSFDRWLPIQMGFGDKFVDIVTTAGWGQSFAIKKDGTLWACGNSELGDGIVTNRYILTQIGTETNWKSISAGPYHVIAIKTDGTLWAWGENNNGELGCCSTGMSQSFPTQIGTGTNWKAVSVATGFSIGIKTDGTLWGWGLSYYNGTGSWALVPTQIGTATNWESISSSTKHTSAIKTDGTLWAWGENPNGELGDGTNFYRIVPIQIGTGTNWKSVAAGETHTIGIKTDGTLWTWGVGSALGDGTTVIRYSPGQIGALTNWEYVYCGPLTSYAIRTDLSLWVCGQNPSGLLGDGTQFPRDIFQQVSCGSSGIEEVDNNSFTVYPNPTNSTLTINTKAIYSSVQIVNMLGQVVFTKEKSTSLNVSSLPSGIYFIQLVDNKGSVIGNKKFVKE